MLVIYVLLEKAMKCLDVNLGKILMFVGQVYKCRHRRITRCKKQFLHRNVKGVEISVWRRERCIRQFVLNVGRNVKFRSSPTQADLFTAENAGRRKETHEEDTRLSLSLYPNNHFLYIFIF